LKVIQRFSCKVAQSAIAQVYQPRGYLTIAGDGL
jgi:hypothetical protein